MKKKNLFLILPFLVILSTSSCMKKQNLDEVDLGPAISADDLEGKMSTDIGKLNYYDINLNESSSFTATTIFEDNQVTKRYRQDLVVSDIKDTASALSIYMDFSKEDYINPANSVVNSPIQLVVDKNKSSLSSNEAKNIKLQENSPKPFFLYQAYIYFAVQGCREPQVTCHNLQRETYKMYLKPELASPLVCADINKCFIDVNKIEFDMLDRSVATNDSKPYRVHYTFLVAPQLPFLSKVMQYCARGLADYGNRQVLAEDCLTINGFSYGQE